MGDLVERVAKALHHAEALLHKDETGYGSIWAWDDTHPQVKERHQASARAAITEMLDAMMEPSEAVTNEGDNVMQGRYGSLFEVTPIWQAMLAQFRKENQICPSNAR